MYLQHRMSDIVNEDCIALISTDWYSLVVERRSSFLCLSRYPFRPRWTAEWTEVRSGTSERSSASKWRLQTTFLGGDEALWLLESSLNCW